MKDIIQTVWQYQSVWVPLAVGLGVGILAIVTGNIVLRRRQFPVLPPLPAAPLEPMEIAGTPSPDYDPFVQGSPSEQRKAFRRTGNPVEIVLKFPDDRLVRPGIVLDRSTGGLRLAFDIELTPGARVLIKPSHASEMVPWTELEVRTCSAVGDSWEAGCQFIKVPPWSVLLMFG